LPGTPGESFDSGNVVVFRPFGYSARDTGGVGSDGSVHSAAAGRVSGSEQKRKEGKEGGRTPSSLRHCHSLQMQEEHRLIAM
jgi:hypothetical protein